MEKYLMKYKTLTCAITILVGMLTAPLALADLNKGLVAHYPFNGNANDESDNGNDGTVNGATLAEDRFGNADSAYAFDGINDYISVDDGSPFNFTHDLSLSLWVKPQSTQVIYAALLNKSHAHISNNGVVKGWNIQQAGDQTNFFGFAYQSNNTAYGTGSFLLEPNVWNHIFVSRENGTLKFYKNGTLLSTYNGSDSSIDTNGSLPLIIGSVNNWSRFFNGFIDDIRFYNRALFEDEIQTLYAGVIDDADCKHATYSLKKRTLTVPFVEMPVVDFLTGQPTGKMELWTGSLRQVSGTTNRFRLINKTVAQITDGFSSSCPATYAVDTGTLSIPYIDVPTGIAVGNNKFENNVEVFKATMTWEPMGRNFVVQEVEMAP
jgi:hypothetical protein